MATRRLFRADFKANVLVELISGCKRAAAVCRKYHLKPNPLANWKKSLVASAPKLFEREHQADPAEVRLKELEWLAAAGYTAGLVCYEPELVRSSYSI